MTTDQKTKARRFKELHHGSEILILPNAWDAASARIFELAGAAAVATTSSGLAASLGHPDGEKIPRELLIGAVRRITETVHLPVSVDIEAGYGTTTSEVCETVRHVLDAGAIGINIEDEMVESGIFVERIIAIRKTATAKGVPLFVNARTDAYLRAEDAGAKEFEDAVRRLRAYEAAGADGLFVPGLRDPQTISRLLAEIHRPLNILAAKGVPPAKQLERIGVSRLSVGSGPMRATLALTRSIANELLQKGTYSAFLVDSPSHAEVNEMFTR